MILYAYYQNINFDQKLIKEVKENVPSSILLSQIDKEKLSEETEVKGHLNTHFMDMQCWNHIECIENEMQYDIVIYKTEMQTISDRTELRKNYVKKKISEKEFISKSKYLDRNSN
jgi:hypothetical protein